jgi:hypothetical protein
VEGHDLGDVAQNSGDLVDHKVSGALLLGLAVQLEEELDVVRVLDGGLRDDVAHGQEGVEALGNGPGKTLLLGLVLGIAGSEVNGDGISYRVSVFGFSKLKDAGHNAITLNGVQSTLGIRSLEISSQLANDKSQLNLVVHVNALGPQNGALIREDNGGGWLKKEEGLLWLGAVKLSDVRSKI